MNQAMSLSWRELSKLGTRRWNRMLANKIAREVWVRVGCCVQDFLSPHSRMFMFWWVLFPNLLQWKDENQTQDKVKGTKTKRLKAQICFRKRRRQTTKWRLVANAKVGREDCLGGWVLGPKSNSKTCILLLFSPSRYTHTHWCVHWLCCSIRFGKCSRNYFWWLQKNSSRNLKIKTKACSSLSPCSSGRIS